MKKKRKYTKSAAWHAARGGKAAPTPHDWARLDNAKSIVANRDLQIGVLTDKLQAAEKRIVNLTAALDHRTKTEVDLRNSITTLETIKSQYEHDKDMLRARYNESQRQWQAEAAAHEKASLAWFDMDAKCKRLQKIVDRYISGDLEVE